MHTQGHQHAFTFSGKGSEYFKIWIANLGLMIVTLGLYAPWAKVRNQRYFYGNTQVAGGTFDFHADPMQIFKSRMLALGLFILFTLFTNLVPEAVFLWVPIFLFVTPWVIVRSMAFEARNSSWRGVRFGFEASYWQALLVFVLGPILAVASLGLALPYLQQKMLRFIVGNSEFGQHAFKSNARVSEVYKIYLLAVAIAAVLVGLPSYLLISWASAAAEPAVFSQVVGLTVFAAILVIQHISSVWTMNLALNTAELGNARFEGRVKAGRLFWISLTNLVLILLTLGLAIPWAKIRVARYFAESVTLHAENVDAFVAAPNQDTSSFGEQVGEVFDLGLAM